MRNEILSIDISNKNFKAELNGIGFMEGDYNTPIILDH